MNFKFSNFHLNHEKDKYNIFGFKLSFKIRKVLSKFLGSSCNVCVLENNK